MGRGDEATLLYLIKQVELAVRARLDEVTSACDLTSVQYTALTVLERHPGTTSAELARTSFVRAQSMAQMITDLTDRGFVTRAPDPNSRRQYLLSLTPHGERTLHDLREPVRVIEAEMLSALTAGDARRLGPSLRACRAGLAGGGRRRATG